MQLLVLSVQERPRGRNSKDGEAEEGSVGPAGRKTLETLGAADSITEALEMAATEVQRQQVTSSCCCKFCGITSQCSKCFTPVAHLDVTSLACISATCKSQHHLQ